jgi:Bacterial cadherin-like domain
MRSNHLKATLKAAIFAVTVLLSTACVSSAQTVNLTASQQVTTLPDGNTVPMWGWTCGTVTQGTTPGTSCTALTYNTATGTPNPQAGGTIWQPPLIVVPYVPGATNLTINLTNALPVETSLVIIGQAGGGLGAPVREAGPRTDGAHGGQTATTWTTVTPGSFTPPTQGERVRSFTSMEVPGVATVGATPAMGVYSWTNLNPGTYLIRTGTYPSIQGPMGLYGVLVVTKAPVTGTPGLAYPVPAGQASTGVTYDADVVALESEIDPRQNNMVAAIFPTGGAVGSPTATPGFSETQVWRRSAALGPVTAITVSGGGNGYSLSSAVSITPTTGTGGSGASAIVAALTFSVASATVTGGSGYTANEVLTLSGGGGSGATVTVNAVNSTGAITSSTLTTGGSGYTSAPTVASGPTGTGAVVTATLATTGAISAITVTKAGDGYSFTNPPTVSVSGGAGVVATAVVTGGGCGGGAHTCYPPAVDYTPLYFLINGLAFSKDNLKASALSILGLGTTGNVLVRYVNAGSHMHVPTVDGLSMLLVAEDGYVLPDVALALSAPQNKTLTANNPPPTTCTTCAVGLRIQNEVFQAAGKVFDVIVSPKQTAPGTFDPATYPTWDRSLALSTNSQRDGGMQAILDVNDALGAKLTAAQASYVAVANPDTYAYAPGVTLNISNPGKGVIANDVNVYGVQVSTAPSHGTLTLYPNGTFTYVPAGNTADSFGYCANGTTLTSLAPTCTTVTLNMSVTANNSTGNAPVANPDTFTSTVSSLIRVAAPGVLGNDTDPHSYPLTAVIGTPSGVTVNLSADGSFTAVPATPGTCGPPTGCTFTYQAKNSQNILSNTATATLIFQPGSGLVVHVYDAPSFLAGAPTEITDYKWIIEQDLTPQINPACQQNGPSAPGAPPKPANCPTGVPPTPATQFHTSYMPVIATGCTGPQSCEKGQTVYDAAPACISAGNPVGCSPTAGQHVLAACDGYGVCTPGAAQLPASSPADANLTAANPDGSPAVYYISILSGDSSNAFAYANTKDPSIAGNCTPAAGQTEPSGITESSTCGHTMGGAPIPPATTCTGTAPAFTSCSWTNPVIVKLEPAPLKTATVTGFVFEDDYPLNGEPDTGGGVDALATLEVPLGDFQVEIWDTAGGIGDNTGQMTYDMFNVPLTNALNGTIDPNTGKDACPISKTAPGVGIGVIVVCPQYESDGTTQSPLAGQFVVRNLMQGKFTLIVHPGATREANGEEWLQTNSLDGGHFLDSFLRSGGPAYFQEFGPGGYHVFFGMANPKIINARLAAICAGVPNAQIPFTAPCNNTINGQVTNLHQSRSPNEQLYSSAVYATPAGGPGDPRNYGMLNYTNCFAALGDSDGATIALAKCDPGGNFTFTNVPSGNYGIVIFDQWDDIIVDGSSHALNIPPNTGATNQIINVVYPSFTWQAHLWNRTYVDIEGLGRPVLDNAGNLDPARSPGLIQVPTRVRQTNGKFVNTLFSDIGGLTHFDETFPLFAWYTVESDTTRFRSTGVHAVNDAGGPVDGSSGTYPGILNSTESFGLPNNLRYPGSHYCSIATCTDVTSTPTAGGPGGSTGRIDPSSVEVEGWQGGVSEFDVIDWGKTPYIPGENGGIRGHVANSTTRPFDDPRMLFQNLWMPLVPNVIVNLYQEGAAPDGSTSLTLVDTTTTTSWDAWAQGFHTDSTGATVPNMSCTGQDPINDAFFGYTLAGTPNYLTPGIPLPYNSQYKCYDGYHNLNQLQPAPYDGLYEFPSQKCLTPGATFTIPGNPTLYKCATVKNPAFGQPGALGAGAKPAILPPAKYVTEVVVPPNFELSKEEDLNLLIGDQYIAPVATQFAGAGLGNIFIVPDQASIDAYNPSYTGPYTASNPYNPPFNCPTPTTCTLTPNTTNNGKPSTDMGRTSFGSFGPGGLIEQSAPCVGRMRVVPDYLSIAPESGEVAPFAGSTRPLCDRKEVTLDDQMQANADFFIYTKTPKATSFTGFISDDFSSEFDPASPAFGEKFAVPNVPVSIKDFNGVEISRIYSDQFGVFNGLVYSTWEVDPPNITGYSPNMMTTCMNDPGPIPGPNGTMINDPYYTPTYSNFCYENPFMPGDTTYLDTPVIPTSAFAEGYNPPDCAYPDGTPMIKSVTGDTSGGGAGPWLRTQTSSFTITALGDKLVPNNAYSGPAANSAPYNEKFITRHYGFGAGAQVTVGGVPATCTGGDLSMTCNLPAPTSSGNTVPPCAMQQVGQPAAQCGELVITSANGKQSIDTVTVTIGGKAPSYVAGENTTNNAIQTMIDNATPGDLIIVGPGTYNEMLLMWKPVRLQGAGDGAVTVNANTFPAGKLLEPWRRQVNCLFGLALDGGFITSTHVYDPNPTNPFVCRSDMMGKVDPIPGEPVVGWDASLNGNIAELLQEPTLMGAYEGAGITVLAKGLENNNTANCNPTNATGCIPLNGMTGPVSNNGFNGGVGDCDPASAFHTTNFLCNPSRIDGISFTNSSQGGGGIFLHGWAHNTEVSNNHSFGNGGTLSGGIIVGQPENIDPTVVTTAAGAVALPLLQDHDTYVHNNSVTFNTAYGDELNSATPASAGGVTFCSGSDYYRFNYNWVCGNLSTGNGGGFAHYGFSWNGHVEHNWFVFNQSINPTLTTYGGGAVFAGQAPDGGACENAAVDFDCPPSLSSGAGPGLVINANLFQGNTAEEGSGGGLRLQFINGNDILNNPSNPAQWYRVSVTNNIFGNNVAGWQGGGVSLLDAVLVDFINNTVVSNDSTASAGVLFDSLGAPNADVAPHGCNPTTNPNCAGFQVTTSTPQPAGLSTESHSANLLAAFTNPSVTCPTGHSQCTKFSNPVLANSIFLQNRAFNITVTPPTGGVVQLVPALTQTTTGACPSGANYWDIGVYGDTAYNNHSSGLTLGPTYSLLTVPGAYPGAHNNGPGSSGPVVVSQYCDGSRVPPEIAPQLCSGPNGFANAQGCIQPGTVGVGMTVPGGVPDSLVPPLPLFTLTPAATVDEGSNWINMFYGPLCLSNPTIAFGTPGYGIPLGDYAPAAGSPAIDHIPATIGHPATDFFGNPRPDGCSVTSNGCFFDIGAIEITMGGAGAPTLTGITPASGVHGTSVAVTLAGTNLSGIAGVDVSGTGITVSGIVVVNSTTVTANFAIASTATLGNRTVTVATTGGTISNAVTFTVN